jgi:beta-mannosidase
MAYYTVKRDMAPINLGMARKTLKNPVFKHTRAFIDEELNICGWATNTTLEKFTLLLSLQAFDLSTGKEVFSKEEQCEIPPNSSIELFDITAPEMLVEKSSQAVVFSARLLNLSNRTEVVARCTNWPQPYRYLDMPKPNLAIRVEKDSIVVATKNVPVKGLWLYLKETDSIKFSDNCLDLVPDDEQTIIAKGVQNHDLFVRYYGVGTSGVLMVEGKSIKE